ncbi:MAG: cytochrome c [Flavobacteriales bacterium]
MPGGSFHNVFMHPGKGFFPRNIACFLLFLIILLSWNCGGSTNNETGKKDGTKEQSDERPDQEEGSHKRGKELYEKNCGSCHQRDGRGVPNMYPPLRGTDRVQGPKKKLIRIVLNGLEKKIEVKGKTYERSMPAQDQLSNEKLARILTYIRQNLGNEANSIEPGEVAELRKEGKKE